MSIQEWTERKLEAARSLIGQGSEALRQDNLELANAALSEAAIVLDMTTEDTIDVKRLRAQAYNELGVVHQRRGDGQTAYAFHDQSAQLCVDVLAEDDEFLNNAIATHLNLASLCANADEDEEVLTRGIEAADFARGHVDRMLADGDDEVSGMAVGAYQIGATLKARNGAYEDADTDMERSVELARAHFDAHEGDADHQRILAQAAQGCQQVSVFLFHADEHERAFRWGREAESLSADAFDAIGQEILPIYVVSQINLISYSEKLGHLSDAEDSLWKAIDIIGNDPQLLKRGKDFYEQCRKLSNARLEEGNLPRDEVNEGYEEIVDRIEQIGGLPAELLEDDED